MQHIRVACAWLELTPALNFKQADAYCLFLRSTIMANHAASLASLQVQLCIEPCLLWEPVTSRHTSCPRATTYTAQMLQGPCQSMELQP